MRGLHLKGADSDDELSDAAALIAREHSHREPALLQWVQSHGAGYPGYRREHTRLAYANGMLAGALRVTTDTIQIGEARLRMGGLGWITTASEFRHKGIARELIRHTLNYLREQHYHTAISFGLPNFYRGLGFAPLFQDYAVRIDTLRALRTRMPGGFKARRAKPGDIDALLRLHATREAAYSCSVVRGPAQVSNRWHAWRAATVFIDGYGRLQGYYLPHSAPDALEIEELGVAEPALLDAVLCSCADEAHDLGLPWIRFYVPHDHPVAAHLLSLGALESVLPRGVDEGLMSIVNVGETMESMLPEWEARLLPEAAALGKTEATLLIERQPYRIRVHRGAIDVSAAYGRNKLSVSRADFARLIAGARNADEELEGRPIAITPAARQLLGLLFPRRIAYVWRQDRF